MGAWEKLLEQLGQEQSQSPEIPVTDIDPYASPGQAINTIPQPLLPNTPSPYAPPPMQGDYDANPFAIPEMRRQENGYEDPGSKLMRAALGQTGEKMGGDYFRSGGREWGQDPVDGQGREQGPRGGMSQLDPSETVNYGRTGVDMSGINPTLRVYNFTDDTPLVSKPIGDFNDYRSIPSPFSKMYDGNNEPLLDERGRQRYNDLPGFDYRKVAGAGLTPTTLENGQSVSYDPFNNITYGNRNGQPGDVLIGGLGAEGFDRTRAMANGLNPTTDRNGRPVYYEEGSNRTWERNRDGSAGRQILDVNRDPRYLDGGRAGGGGGGQGGGTPSFRPNTPPVPPVPPVPPTVPVRAVEGGETGTVIKLNGGQIAVPAGGNAIDTGTTVEVTRADGQKITYDKNGKVLSAPSTPTQYGEKDVLNQNQGYSGMAPAPQPAIVPPAPSGYVGPDGKTYRDEAEFTQTYGMSPDLYNKWMSDYQQQRNNGNYTAKPPMPVRR